MAGYLDGVRYGTGTSSYTRSPSATIRAAYGLGFEAGRHSYRDAQESADRIYAPRRARLQLVR